MLENIAYEGIKTLLSTLKEQGKTLYVATSKPWVFAQKIAQHFQLDGYFTHIYGSELDGTRTQKAEVIAYALKDQKLCPKDCVMVGDRMHDILGAKKNQMMSIGVLYGYGSRKELEEANADIIVETIDELKKLVST